jgi:DegV family protein with EDD domain
LTVHIVTDSTCDIPHHLVDDLHITVVPLTITFGGESFRDGLDLTADEFYARLQEAKHLPTTSQPPPALFQHAYTHLASQGEVVSIHLSHKFSGTVETARSVAREVSADRISVVDTGSASMGLGMCVLAAARVARDGGSREECVAAAESVARRLRIAVAFETLEYLRRGGRIGRATAFLGGLLRLKPILTVKDGETFPVTRVRSRAKALDELFALCADPTISEVAVLHTTTPEDAAELAARAQAALPAAMIHVGRFGPVLGVHGGPGMIGLAAVCGKSAAEA